MASRFKILISWVQERNPDIPPFSLKKSQQVKPLQVPQWRPYGEIYLLTGYFYVSLNISLFIFPSESPVKDSPPCSLTGSPWTGILRHQSQWSIYSLIPSFVYVCLSPQKGALLHMGKNIRSPYTEPLADGRSTYNGVWPGSPRTCGVSHTLFPLTISAQTLPYNREQKFECVYLGFLPLMAGLWRLVKEIVNLIHTVQKITVVHTKYSIKEPQLWFKHTAQNSHNSLKYFILSHRWLKWVL
jgi:hypothetical protein